MEQVISKRVQQSLALCLTDLTATNADYAKRRHSEPVRGGAGCGFDKSILLARLRKLRNVSLGGTAALRFLVCLAQPRWAVLRCHYHLREEIYRRDAEDAKISEKNYFLSPALL